MVEQAEETAKVVADFKEEAAAQVDDFVALRGQEYGCKPRRVKGKGNITRFPLDKLSAEDQKFAREAAEKMRIKIEARAFPIDRTVTKGVGKSTVETILAVEVELRREDIGESYVLREVELEDVVVGGKTLALVKSKPPKDVYDTLERLNDARFGDGDVSDIRSYIKYGPLGRVFASPKRQLLPGCQHPQSTSAISRTRPRPSARRCRLLPSC